MQSSQPTMSAPEANTASMWRRTTTCSPAGSHTVKNKKQAKLRVHAASIGAHAAKLDQYHQNATKLSVHAASVGAHAAKLSKYDQHATKLSVHAASVGAHATKLHQYDQNATKLYKRTCRLRRRTCS